MTTENMDGILRRIQKLLAIAQDDRADANEAAAAAGMAEKLMRKFQLDNADVIATSLKVKGGNALSSANVFAGMKRDDPKRTPMLKNPSWSQFLAVNIARLNDCEVRQNFAENKFGVRGACLTFYGYSGDVQVCAFTFDYLVGAIIRAIERFNKEQRKLGQAEKSSSEAYRRGFTGAIELKMTQQIAEKNEALEHISSSRALVVVKSRAIAEEFGDFGYKKSTQAQIRDAQSFRAGVKDGHAVDINQRGIGSNSNNVLQLN
jgi:Protein of unknown function (DUF2786)